MSEPEARVVDEAMRLANRTHKLAAECGVEALGRRLEWEARRWRERQTTVVITGETRRGKTSLVNALLGCPGLLPVGEAATTSPVVVRRASTPYVRVTRRRADETVCVDEIPRAQLAELVTDAGDPGVRAGVVAVEVGADEPLLAGDLVLVDTPGIGAMSPGLREAALGSAAEADLVLVVLAADEPVLRSEVDFLLEVSERVDSVVFVVNRTDLNPDWQDMRREHRDRIRHAAELRRAAGAADPDRPPAEALRQAERLDALAEAPMLATSARLALRALSRGGGASRELAARSGIEEVRALLTGVVTRRDDVRARNVVRLVDSVARRIEVGQTTLAAAAAEAGGRLPSALEADVAALNRDLTASARWRRMLRVGSQHLQSGAGSELGRRIDAVEVRYREHFATLPATETAAAAETIADDLERSVGALCAGLSAWLAERADAEFAELRAELGEAVALAVSLEHEVAGPPRSPDPGQREGRAMLTVEHGLPLVTQSWVLGNLAGALVGVAAVGWAVLPIGAAVMAPIALVRHRRRALARSRQELERTVRDTLAHVRRELTAALGTRLVDLAADLEARIDDVLLERRAELDHRRRALEALARQHEEHRRRAAREAAERVDRARDIRAAAETLRARLSLVGG